MTTVFAVHRVKEDVSPAEAYGSVRYVNSRYVYPDETVNNRIPANVQTKLEKAVDEFDPDHDYVLIAGDHLQLIAFAALLANRWGDFKVLRFDREAGGYYPLTITIGNYTNDFQTNPL